MHHHDNRGEDGYVTIFEFFYFVLGAALSYLIADLITGHMEGGLRTVVLYSVRIVGTLVFGLSFVVVAGHLRARRKPPSTDKR